MVGRNLGPVVAAVAAAAVVAGGAGLPWEVGAVQHPGGSSLAACPSSRVRAPEGLAAVAVEVAAVELRSRGSDRQARSPLPLERPHRRRRPAARHSGRP